MAQGNGGLRIPEYALPDSVVKLNESLADWYGIDSDTGRPIFRIVWANNEMEIRYGTWSDVDENTGELIRRVTETRLVPKYEDEYRDKFVLERLVLIPECNEAELPVTKMSYEPLWTFENVLDRPVPPTVGGTRLVIDTVLAAIGKKSMHKYVAPSVEESIELRRDRIQRIQDELYGDSSDIADALHLHSGIIVPGLIKKES